MHTNLWKDFMNEPMRALHEQQCRRESGRTAHNSDEWLPTADRLQTAAEARQGCSKLFTVISSPSRVMQTTGCRPRTTWCKSETVAQKTQTLAERYNKLGVYVRQLIIVMINE